MKALIIGGESDGKWIELVPELVPEVVKIPRFNSTKVFSTTPTFPPIEVKEDIYRVYKKPYPGSDVMIITHVDLYPEDVIKKLIQGYKPNETILPAKSSFETKPDSHQPGANPDRKGDSPLP